MPEIPVSHPRRASLLARQRLVDAAAAGMLADSALIAHGRGEAFDYLLGEKTCPAANLAIREAAARLAAAEHPIISVNGNAVALAADDLLRCAALLGCPIEVNIYYRTAARMKALLGYLNGRKAAIKTGAPPTGWGKKRWQEVVENILILGEDADGIIAGLEGPRAVCCRNGIEKADTILVPLEDGDRCSALVALGKEVIVVDLNPISRTARIATITIVDELSRMAPQLIANLSEQTQQPLEEWDNDAARQGALRVMLQSLERDN